MRVSYATFYGSRYSRVSHLLAGLSGGDYRMLGTLMGAFTIAVIQNGMNLCNVERLHPEVVLGLVILAAVLLDTLRHKF